MGIIAIIPAKIGSTRLPEKPLQDINGKTIIQRAYETVAKCGCFNEIIVATDSQKIVDAVNCFGGKAELTKRQNRNGTEATAEISEKHGEKIVFSIQCDKLMPNPEPLKRLAKLMLSDKKINIGTIVCPTSEPNNPNRVKVVLDEKGNVLYYSRSPIPFQFNRTCQILKSGGVYAFRKKTLMRYVSWKPTPLEKIEKIEQLRALEKGIKIRAVIAKSENITIDTPEDLEKAREMKI
jgi:3-deoxy-manno-octulosonate cytidylyltransferase (CMP-KDO synthetase)